MYKARECVTTTPRDVMTMIDWDSKTWGNQVHLCANGSWVRDRHDPAAESDDR